jgi:hypothetical protein
MTHEDFEVVARALYGQLMPHRYRVLIAKSLADAFQKKYPRFDRMRFMHAALYNKDSRYADEVKML